jgi:hypothetical protein
MNFKLHKQRVNSVIRSYMTKAKINTLKDSHSYTFSGQRSVLTTSYPAGPQGNSVSHKKLDFCVNLLAREDCTYQVNPSTLNLPKQWITVRVTIYNSSCTLRLSVYILLAALFCCEILYHSVWKEPGSSIRSYV